MIKDISEIKKKIILMNSENRHDQPCQMIQTDKKLKDFIIQIPEKKPE